MAWIARKPNDGLGGMPVVPGAQGPPPPPAAAGGGAPMGAAPAQPVAAAGGGPAPQQQPGTGYVNLQRYLGLNQEQGVGMARSVIGDLKGMANPGGQGGAAASDSYAKHGAPGAPAQSNLPPAQSAELAARARLAGGQGVGTLIASHYAPNGGYSAGQQGLDAFLAQGAAGGALRNASAAYGRIAAPPTAQPPTTVGGTAAPGGGPTNAGGGAQTGPGYDDRAEYRRLRRHMGIDIRSNPYGTGG